MPIIPIFRLNSFINEVERDAIMISDDTALRLSQDNALRH